MVCLIELDELTDYELGYIAGMIDGEGSLVMTQPKNTRCYTVYGEVTNTNSSVIDFLECLCGGNISADRRKKHPDKPWKPSYRVIFPKYILQKLLPIITLVIKRKQKELLLEAISMMNYHEYSDSERSRLEEIYQEMRKLNKKGRPVKKSVE